MRFKKRSKSSFVIIGSHEVINKKGEKETRLKALPRKLALKRPLLIKNNDWQIN